MNRQLYAGASGYSYKEWKGTFYSSAIKPDDAGVVCRAPAYGRNQQHVLPDAEGTRAQTWASTTPAHFRFAIKASQRITHMARLKAEAAESSSTFMAISRRSATNADLCCFRRRRT